MSVINTTTSIKKLAESELHDLTTGEVNLSSIDLTAEISARLQAYEFPANFCDYAAAKAVGAHQAIGTKSHICTNLCDQNVIWITVGATSYPLYSAQLARLAQEIYGL